MKTTIMAAATLVATGPGTPALAFETLTFGDFSFTPGLGVNLTASKTRGEDTESNAYGYLDATLVWSHTTGALTFGAEAYSYLEFDNDVEGPNLYVYDDPYIDLGLWLEGESFGYLAYSYTSSAIGESCIEAPYAGDNYTHTDYVAVGTCPSYDLRSVLYYRTPDLGHGLKLAVSYMPETGFESVEDGDATESASVALIWDHEDASGANWNGTFGFEKVLNRQGGGAKPTAWQAGLNWSRDGWTLGGAAVLVDNGDGTRDHSLALSAQREVTDKLKVSLGVNGSRSRAEGAMLDETSVSLLAIYSFVPDKVMFDAGLWHVEADDTGVRSDRNILALGVSLYF
jgi:hypothetical protein